MRRLGALVPLALLALAAPGVAAAAPAPPAAQGARIAALTQQLTRTTPLELVAETKLQARTWHPEGIVRHGDRWLLSTVEVTESPAALPGGPAGGFDRTPGAGVGHLMAFDASGKLLQDQVLGATETSNYASPWPGPLEYHPGGLDYDGRSLWVTMAQYRPNSTATILRVDPRTLAATPVLRAGDHLGGIVHDTVRDRLVTLNWGSRTGTTWRIPARPRLDRVAAPLATRRNPSAFIDYQDCKYLGAVPGRRDPLMLCGGLTGYGTFQLGGIALVDVRTLEPVWEVPITKLTPAGNVLTRNPIDVQVVGGKLRLHLAPDDDATTIYTYEAEL